MLTDLKAAPGQFQDLVSKHAASKTEFNMLIESTRSGSNMATEERWRQQAFEGNAFTWGARCKVLLGMCILMPSEDREHYFHAAQVRGLMRFRQTRPNVRWVVSQSVAVDDDVQHEQAMQRAAIDPASAAEHNGVPVLPRFCSHPMPSLERSGTHDGMVQDEFLSSDVSLLGERTLVTGEILQNIAPVHATPQDKVAHFGSAVRTPAERERRGRALLAIREANPLDRRYGLHRLDTFGPFPATCESYTHRIPLIGCPARWAGRVVVVAVYLGAGIPVQVAMVPIEALRTGVGMKRFLFGLFGGLLIAVVAIGALAPLLLQTPLADRLMKKEEVFIEVKLESAELGSLTRTINAPGEIEPETNVEISAQVSARVVDLPFDEGDTVKRNDVVVRLDDRDLQAALDAAKAQVVADRARLLGADAEVDEAEASLKRQESLYETNDTSLASLEAADARVRRAKSTIGQINAAIDISQARIRQAERDLDNTTIRSPIDGVMTRRQAEVGELVVVGTLNNPGSVILEIADLSRMLVKARIDESNVSLVEVGQQTTIYLNAYPDAQFSGQVKFVGLARQLWRDGSGYVVAEILLLNEDVSRLQTGLTSNVDIAVSTLRNVVKVPSQAIVDRRIEELPSEVVDTSDLIDTARTFTRVVYIMDDEGVARAKPVQVGSSDLTHTVITAGLDAGERVIAGPFKVLNTLTDGTKVKEHGDSDQSEDKPTEPETVTAESSEATETAGGGG